MQARFLLALHGVGARSKPRHLCEDFCGPASIARAWAALDPRHRAAGVDLDAEPLQHAALRAQEQGLDSPRFRTVRQDVRRTSERAHVIAAFNFALCELHERATLVRYLKRARERLIGPGIFAADVYGGPSAFMTGTETRDLPTPAGRVRYTWEQRRTDPLASRVENAMHFVIHAKAGTRPKTLRNAFVYDWRLWSVGELRDAMIEAGFASVEVHLSYGGAMDESGALHVAPVQAWEAEEEDFVAYVVGRKSAR